jgi:alanine racemase
MSEGILRNTYAEVNVTNFLRNIFEIHKRTKMPVAPVLKANAYGHGAVQLAKACERSSASFLIVAFLEEAIQLRKAGSAFDILVLNYFKPKYVLEALKYDISITAFSLDQMKEIVGYLKGSNKRLKVHMNVDTGMSRLGVKMIEKAKELHEFLTSADELILKGIYTHLASADVPSDPMNSQQMMDFESFLKMLPRLPQYVHACNSAGSLLLKNCIGNISRIGIALYGLQPSTEHFIDYIQPVMSLHSTIAEIKKLKKGQSIGYGHIYTAHKEKKIAIVPIGYADGVPRSLSNKGSVLIKGKRAKMLGRVSMDQMTVDISEINDARIGEDVVIFGKSEKEEIRVEEIAQMVGTLNYEIVCGISSRVPRVYVRESGVSM